MTYLELLKYYFDLVKISGALRTLMRTKNPTESQIPINKRLAFTSLKRVIIDDKIVKNKTLNSPKTNLFNLVIFPYGLYLIIMTINTKYMKKMKKAINFLLKESKIELLVIIN